MIERVQLAVVGAGPAGMEAAITAAEAGVEVIVVDSYPRLCGELVARAIASELGVLEGRLPDIETVGVFTARAPIHPLPLSALVEAAEAMC
jgi:NADPH-dependent 2,4-dienoyl-CoA reductase/sulfur reductase-like enzyme